MKYYQTQTVAPYKGLRLNYQQHEYEFNGSNWFDAQSKGIPPLSIVARLNAMTRDLMTGQHT